MIYALKAFRDDKRSGADTLMTSVVLGKSDADLAALAHYAASRKPYSSRPANPGNT
jgi:cytochrome c553